MLISALNSIFVFVFATHVCNDYPMRFLNITVENRVLRPEQIIMGTSGIVLDWIMKKKVGHYFLKLN